jgi:acetyltransferase-like isoleucine patch superfamily enzyme
MTRDVLKQAARGAALVAVSPCLLSFAVRRRLLGADRALQSTSQTLSLVPGLTGQYLRRAFLSVALDGCAPTAVVEFGTTFSQQAARLDDRVYVGPYCTLGRVHLEADVLVASGVHIPSGAHTHGTSDVVVPIREQEGDRRLVTVGAGSWIGAAAVILADVGRNCVIGAGAVVTAPVPDDSVAVGVPAKVVRSRSQPCASSF